MTAELSSSAATTAGGQVTALRARCAGTVNAVRRPGVRLDVLVVLGLTLLVASPELFTLNGFGLDFTNHMWLVEVQERAISAHGYPTFFFSTPQLGVFYPFFMFYGGTLYAFTGGLAVLLGGSVRAAYLIVSFAAMLAASGGVVWLARQLGSRSWAAWPPAVAFLCSAYYVTNLYGRGAWPEFIATSMIPLLAAVVLWQLRAPRLRPGPAILFIVAVTVFAGSHNVTLLFGTIFLVLIGVLLASLGGRSTLPGWNRIGWLAALALLGVALDFWFLLPDLAYSAKTEVARAPEGGFPVPYLNMPGRIFAVGRPSPAASGTPGLYVELPVCLLAWVLFAVLFHGRRASRQLLGAALGLAILLSGVLVAWTLPAGWEALPRILRDAQFPYRLDTYATLSIAGLLIVAVLMRERVRRGLTTHLTGVALLAATVFSVLICAWQLWVPNIDFPNTSYHDVNRIPGSPHVLPHSWYAGGDYADRSLPIIPTAPLSLIIPPTDVHSDHVTVRLRPPYGQAPFVSNISGGPYTVQVGGQVRELGRTGGGYMVLRPTVPGNRPITITLRTAGGAAIIIGRYVSLLALLGCLLALCGLAVRALRTRRRTRD